MNILIVGNGFDLSHYLPTKYDHFMVAMNAIENWDLSKEYMGFDEFFGADYWYKNDETGEEWQNNFFQHTKAMYLTEAIAVSKEEVKELQNLLKENVWYQYFSDHVREVKTWIDFETKINDALNVIAHFIKKTEYQYSETGSLSSEICFYGDIKKTQIFIKREYCNVLNIFKIFNSGYYLDEQIEDGSGYFYTKNHDVGDPEIGSFRFYINNHYLQYRTGFSNLKIDLIFQNLQSSLDSFISIFNKYLELIVSQLKSKNQLKIHSNCWMLPEIIYSFNYTNTYQRLHYSKKIEYLHGNHGKDHNIVLGVSDLMVDSLKEIKAFGFTKYHQKLFKNTDYLFLDTFIKESKMRHKNYEKAKMLSDDKFQPRGGWSSTAKEDTLKKMRSELNPKMNISIWGHSLDVSDKDYIIDLFSLNDEVDRNVRVIVYHFNKTAKFDLLNNLLAILGKEKVEHWMKNKWLQFEENPKITTEDAITLKDLPKM